MSTKIYMFTLGKELDLVGLASGDRGIHHGIRARGVEALRFEDLRRQGEAVGRGDRRKLRILQLAGEKRRSRALRRLLPSLRPRHGAATDREHLPTIYFQTRT
jgi:hypothetical protein